MSDKEVGYVTGVGQSSVWGPTMQLRFVNRMGRIHPVLQQLWREHGTGAEDWRDVPYLGSEDAPARVDREMTPVDFMALPLVAVGGLATADSLSTTVYAHQGFERGDWSWYLDDIHAVGRGKLGDLRHVLGDRDNPFWQWPFYAITNETTMGSK